MLADFDIAEYPGSVVDAPIVSVCVAKICPTRKEIMEKHNELVIIMFLSSSNVKMCVVRTCNDDL